MSICYADKCVMQHCAKYKNSRPFGNRHHYASVKRHGTLTDDKTRHGRVAPAQTPLLRHWIHRQWPEHHGQTCR